MPNEDRNQLGKCCQKGAYTNVKANQVVFASNVMNTFGFSWLFGWNTGSKLT